MTSQACGSTEAGPKMFRRKYTLAKDTPKLKAGTAVWFDPFRGDYTNEPISLAARGPIERFSFAEVEDPEWFTPASELIPFRPPMIQPSKVTTDLHSDRCVRVSVESAHNDMCDWCRNARDAIERTQAEVLDITYRILKRHYDAGFAPEPSSTLWEDGGMSEIPTEVTEAAVRLRSDIREAIEVCYGELGGKDDTPEDVAGTERAIASDMATVLDWITQSR